MNGPEPPASWADACLRVIDDWNKALIVTSTDVDGVLSALLLQAKFGARIAGLYTTTDLFVVDDYKYADLVDALWTDLEISHPGVRCVGQHLILHSLDDKLPRRHPVSFNPNQFFGQDFFHSFVGYGGRRRDKYPFATAHFIATALGAPYPKRGTPGYASFAHADGAWHNVILYEYNCSEWYDLMFLNDPMIADLMQSYVPDPEALKSHVNLVEELRSLGLPKTTSSNRRHLDKIPVAWRELIGTQKVRFRIGDDLGAFCARFNALYAFLSRATGMRGNAVRRVRASQRGRVDSPYPDKIARGAFDDLMVSEEIFSHAITSLRELRYTTRISLTDE